MNLSQTLEEALHRVQAGDPQGALSLLSNLGDDASSHPGVWHVVGLATFALGWFVEASDGFGRARSLEPDNPAHAINLANALIKLDRDNEARDLLDAALALDPNSADALIALGILARREGRLEEAVLCADRALFLKPDSYPAWGNRGRALHELGRFSDAVESYERAIAIDPEAPPAHAQMALSLLLTGDFARGWAEYGWRGEGSDLVSRRRFDQPEWQGEDLNGGTLLVHAEQGYGDTIQFARFLPLAEARNARVILEMQPALRRLFTGLSPSIDMVARDEAVPSYQHHIRLLSLPAVLGVGIDEIPPPVALPPPSGSRIALPPDHRLTVGLSWAGRPTHENDRNRSIDPELLAPLGQIANVRWVSVQKDPPGPLAGFIELDLGPQLDDFVDLAAAMQGLDLLLTIDSAPAHLMGSLGRPVWVLLPDPPDWRWLLGREDSPWYPSARLFRQRERGNWPELVGRVTGALQALLDQKAAGSPARSD